MGAGAMSKPYRVILFDCFNTLYLQDPSRVPQLELDGKQVPSTAGLVAERLRVLDPSLQPETVHRAHRSAWKWAEGERGPDLAEVPAPRRFKRMFQELGLIDVQDALAQEVLEVHMRTLTGTFTFPDAHRHLLERLRLRYRLSLLSNFDHGPTLRRLLEDTGIADWFDPLLVSDGLGFRKPGPAAFAAALDAIGEPAESVLYVGDSLEDDVQGCRSAGIDVAWLNAAGAEAPPDCMPTYEMRALPDLGGLLGHLE